MRCSATWSISLGAQAYGVIRAFAIAIYLVFVVLAVLASQRDRRGFWPLIVVSAVFMMLVWRPYADFPTPISRWMAALLLVVIAAHHHDPAADGQRRHP